MNCGLTHAGPRAMSYHIMMANICVQSVAIVGTLAMQVQLIVHISNGHGKKDWDQRKANFGMLFQTFRQWNLYVHNASNHWTIIRSELNIILDFLHNLGKLISTLSGILLQSYICSFLILFKACSDIKKSKSLTICWIFKGFPYWWCVSFQETGSGNISRDWEHR